MGNMFGGNKGDVLDRPKQGVINSPYQGQQMVQGQPQYGPQAFQSQQVPYGYGPPPPSGQFMPRYGVPSQLSLSNSQNRSSYGGNAFISNLTGWSYADIERLQQEFLSYANSHGVIDREGFQKLYIASLLNSTWGEIERESEVAFRSFDINRTGTLDFNEYVTACTHMTR